MKNIEVILILLSLIISSSGFQLRCCSIGRSWLSDSSGTHDHKCRPRQQHAVYSLSTTLNQSSSSWQHQKECDLIAEVCCTAEHRRRQCRRGQDVALADLTCNIDSDDSTYSGNENAESRECCQCCRLGMMAKESHLPCETTDLYSLQCQASFIDCCRQLQIFMQTQPLSYRNQHTSTHDYTHVSTQPHNIISHWTGDTAAAILRTTTVAPVSEQSLMTSGKEVSKTFPTKYSATTDTTKHILTSLSKTRSDATGISVASSLATVTLPVRTPRYTRTRTRFRTSAALEQRMTNRNDFSTTTNSHISTQDRSWITTRSPPMTPTKTTSYQAKLDNSQTQNSWTTPNNSQTMSDTFQSVTDNSQRTPDSLSVTLNPAQIFYSKHTQRNLSMVQLNNFEIPQTVAIKTNVATTNSLQVEERDEVADLEQQKCYFGFVYNSSTDSCEDIDECVTEGCKASNMVCRNSPGSYACYCVAGFQLNIRRQACDDVNECLARRHTCDAEEETCENTVGSFLCRPSGRCRAGFTLHQISRTCIDIDECASGVSVCETGSTCINVVGSFSCYLESCPVGLRLTHNRSRCIDINECEEDPRACPHGFQCVNVIGSFTCQSLLTCLPGFVANSQATKCEDANECELGTHSCTADMMTCSNRPGSYVCQCPDGYKINQTSFTCEDVDECRTFDGRVCAPNSRCQNIRGSFLCLCLDGFETDSLTKQCKDIDECVTGISSCQHVCRNTWGSYYCSCSDGYQLQPNGRSCSDIDECIQWREHRSNPLCMGLCQNVEGSYLCLCPDGYQMSSDGRTCEDIDECSDSWVDCIDSDDHCVNTRGGYVCQNIRCPAGFLKAPKATNLLQAARRPVSGINRSRKHSDFTRNRRTTTTAAVPHKFLRSIFSKPMSVYANEESGVICQKVECGANDVSCILNLTKTIQWQYIDLPTISVVKEPLIVFSLETVFSSHEFTPNNHYLIVNGNSQKLFDFVKTKATPPAQKGFLCLTIVDVFFLLIIRYCV